MQISKEEDVLVVIDVQNDFCPGGALPVADGDLVIDVIHTIAAGFKHIVVTQDWHPPGHQSFASSHANKKPFDSIELSYGPQTLWPDHCIQDTEGAKLHPRLALTRAELILRKGFRADVDSYSAFFENDRATSTGLAGYLLERGVKRIFLAGLAYDYCVAYSALDARNLGFSVTVIRDGCRAIDIGGSVVAIEEKFAQAGVILIESAELLTIS